MHSTDAMVRSSARDEIGNDDPAMLKEVPALLARERAELGVVQHGSRAHSLAQRGGL